MCLLIFGDKLSACKHRPLLYVPPFSCRAKRNHPSPRRAFGVGPFLPPLDSQDARSKGSDLTRSGWRDAPGGDSEERPASEVQRSVVVSLFLKCSAHEIEQKMISGKELIFQDGMTWRSRRHGTMIAMLVKSLLVCLLFVIAKCSSVSHTGPLNSRKGSAIVVV